MLGSTRIYIVLIVLSNSVFNGWMDESAAQSVEELYAIDIIVPKNYVALGGTDLNLKFRLSPDNYFTDNRTKTSRELIQLPHYPTEVILLSIHLSFEEDDGTMSLVTRKDLPTLPSLVWDEINFECGYIVRGGIYNIRLVEIYKDSSNSGADRDDDYSYYYYFKSLNGVPLDNTRKTQVSITTVYPTIDFEVPHRLESYTTSVLISFGLTKSLCKPKLPLPSTILILTRVTQYSVAPTHAPDGFSNDHLIGPTTLILDNPLQRLEKEGQVSVTVKCHLWARNATYRIEIWEEGSSQKLITSSEPIKVEWSSKFGLNLPKKSIIPCRGSLRVYVSYPNCVLPGRDKIRIYGFEALPVPSHLAPKRLSYISEKQILTNQTDGRVVTFPCSLFPQRFSQYCFQYVNTAEDESVAIVIERCIPTFYSDKFSDGGWGSWSDWSECSALSDKCGNEGKRFRYRFCDSPPPTFGGNFCQGNSVEEMLCSLEDTGQPECSFNKDSSAENSNSHDYIYNDPEDGNNDYNQNFRRKSQVQLKKKSRNSLSLFYKNLKSTFGCECGCILHDLVPGLNYSLLISLNSNHTTCEDEDEEEHHNLKWVLHAKENGDRIKFSIIEAEVQCISVSFRDGNTTDSNLLEVISTSSSLTHNNDLSTDEPMPSSSSKKKNSFIDKTGEIIDNLVLLSFESTGGSLSIGAADELNIYNNCSSPSLTFFAVYQIIEGSKLETTEALFTENDYEFWTILFLKLVLTLFILIAFCSMLSGCASKVYKYKRLKVYGTEEEYDEDVELGTTEGGELLPGNSSRSTSVTIMSFDYTYWKQIRLQRLKYFLLRPKKLNLLTGRTNSFPNTPVHVVKKRLNGSNTTKQEPRGIIVNKTNKSETENEKLRVKSISLSDTNLECVRYQRLYEISLKERHDNDNGRRESLNVNETHSATLGSGGAFYMNSETETKNEKKSFRSTVSVQPSLRPNPMSIQELRTEKERKEHENLHRKRNEKWNNKDIDGCVHRSKKSPKLSSTNSRPKYRTEDLRPDSGVQHNTDSASDLNSMNDFELDYYDYDILNAGNIPGSYLLEPSFVFWSDPAGSTYDPMQSSLSDPGNNDIELLNTSVSTGLFTPSSEAQGLGIKETSFDTLNLGDEIKFADDDDDTTTISDVSAGADNYEQTKEEKLRKRQIFPVENYHITNDLD